MHDHRQGRLSQPQGPGEVAGTLRYSLAGEQAPPHRPRHAASPSPAPDGRRALSARGATRNIIRYDPATLPGPWPSLLASLWWLSALLSLCCCKTREAAERGSAAREPPPVMARDQLFFVGTEPTTHKPVVAALILQREPLGQGALIEAKGFFVWQDRWTSPFYERVEIEAWPGNAPAEALAAYQRARRGTGLRLSWDDKAGIRAAFRSPSREVVVTTPALSDAGSGRDPHGQVSWRAGVGELSANGRRVPGVVLVERLSQASARIPRFGQFEMWLLALDGGALLLARCHLGRGCEAIRVSSVGVAQPQRISAEVTTQRIDPSSKQSLPQQWRMTVGDRVLRLRRIAGSVGHGKGPDGGPAVYDVAHVRAQEGLATGIVFHLQDLTEARQR